MATQQNQSIQLEQAEERTLRYISPTDISIFEPKRVAVYARVSSEGDLKHHSIEAQKENLKQDVISHPGWIFAGCYVDEGVTGTKLDRPSFNRLMRDARAGKIDIILTKSVSRFGRNIAAVQRIIQELKEMNVTVMFANENIDTANPEASFNLQFLAIQAEAEARQNSEYQKWSIRCRFAEGIPTYARVYGYQMNDHKYYVIPEEAEIIKRIYKMYLSGMGIEAISKQLNAEGIPSPRGTIWQSTSLCKILDNEKYAGDLLLQKTYTADFLTKLKKNNHGEVPQYYVEDTHEPIIDRETFEKVKQERARRRTKYGGYNKNPLKNTDNEHMRILSQLLVCGSCRRIMTYKRYKYHNKDQYREVWVCANHTKHGTNSCPTKSIREDIVIKTAKSVLIKNHLIKPETELTNDLLHSYLKEIVVLQDQKLEFNFQDGKIITMKWEYESRSKSWTPEMKQKAREKALSTSNDK